MERLWEMASLRACPGTGYAVPGPRQLISLWESSLKNATLTHSLLRPEALASQLRETRELVVEWQLDLADPSWFSGENENHAAFYQWNRIFEKRCKKDHWISPEDRLAPLFRAGKRATVVTESPDGRARTLSLDIGPCLPALSYGLRNVPDGEIFTSPVASATEGEIYLDLPNSHAGQDIRGIFLRFEAGRIVEYRAEIGEEHLRAIVETDEGSRRLGEFALGMNPGLARVLKHPLFVEKVGGTVHVALGASYVQCYVEDPDSEAGKKKIEELAAAGTLNRSARHVDLVADFRPGGCGRSVRIDDAELVVRDGVWAPR